MAKETWEWLRLEVDIVASSLLSSSANKGSSYRITPTGVLTGYRSRNMYYLTSKSGSRTVYLPNPEKPDGVQGTIATMVNSARNTKAQVTAQKIGEDQIKYELSWSLLSCDEWEELLRFWNSNFIFRLHYYDSVLGKRSSRLCYISDRTYQYLDVVMSGNQAGTPTGYINCSVSMVDTGRN